jgi:hypothetical protein
MQIESPTNEVLVRAQTSGTQHGLNRLTNLCVSMARASKVRASEVSRLRGLQKLRRMISILSITDAGPVAGSGSAAPPKQLPIRSPDSSLKESKKPRAALGLLTRLMIFTMAICRYRS